MTSSISDIRRFGDHDNAFGFLRLVLAAMVILAHTPELVDGNRSRELLTRVFGTLSFGELAVDGFFVVSGYLITGSYLKKPIASVYLLKRVARIYPAYVVCFLVCLLVVGPLAGASFTDIWTSLHLQVLRLAVLRPPVLPDTFAGMPYPALNGSMWTIALEFGCYLMVLLLGATGWLRRPPVILALAIGCMMIFECTDHHPIPRLAGTFLAGTLFYLWRERIAFTPRATAVAGAILVALLFVPWLAHEAVASFGAYVIFSIASRGGAWPIAQINNRVDISYGLYLYAWPIEMLVLWFVPGLPLAAAGLLTLILASACGWVSWHALEKHAIQGGARWTRTRITHQPRNARAASSMS